MTIEALPLESGQLIGRWTLLHKIAGSPSQWVCRCHCGTERSLVQSELKRGKTKSCGCFRNEMTRERGRKHGESSTPSPEYTAWRGIKYLCKQGKSCAGISVYKNWEQDFSAFLAYVGRRPTSEHFIARIDASGNFEPGNVHWTTAAAPGPTSPNEEWRDVPGHEGKYQASSLGRIRSCDRLITCKGKGGAFRTWLKKGRILKPTPNHKRGCAQVGLSRKSYRYHTIIILTFVGPRPRGLMVCHRDGDWQNNVPANLRYDTPAENERDKQIRGALILADHAGIDRGVVYRLFGRE